MWEFKRQSGLQSVQWDYSNLSHSESDWCRSTGKMQRTPAVKILLIEHILWITILLHTYMLLQILPYLRNAPSPCSEAVLKCSASFLHISPHLQPAQPTTTSKHQEPYPTRRRWGGILLQAEISPCEGDSTCAYTLKCARCSVNHWIQIGERCEAGSLGSTPHSITYLSPPRPR